MPDLSIHTDHELFNRIAEGDEKAFQAFYVRVKPTLAGFIYKLTKSEDAVREIAQEALFRLWISRDKLASIEHPRTWFFTVVSNECHRYFRQHGLQRRLVGELAQINTTAIAANTTAADTSFHETKRLIATAVHALAPRQKQIYQLSRDAGLRIPEIAAQLNLSETYVKKTLMVCLKTIRKKLVEAGKHLPGILIWLMS